MLANKAHTPSRTPLPGLRGVRVRFDFAGLSSVTDADGRTADRLADEEGIAIADVLVDPSKKHRPAPPAGQYWSRPPPGFPRLTGVLYVVMEQLGKRAYARNVRRPMAARAVAPAG